MNRYGALLMRQWKLSDPTGFSQIEDPEQFFAERGQALEAEIQALADSLAGPDRPGETYLEKTARLSTARVNAESDLLREAMIPGPEEETPLPEEWQPLSRSTSIEDEDLE